MPEMSYAEPRLFARARPIRVAYFLADDALAHVTLDAIFAECNSRWGGRYSLVVPCTEGFPRAAYLPWLQAYDPDVIYSYIDLNEAKLGALHEQLGPAYLLRHDHRDRGERDQHFFRPELPIGWLTSLSLAPMYSRASLVSRRPLLLIDYLPGEPRTRFVDDNFGSHSGSFGRWPLPPDLADAVRPLTLAGPDRLEAFRGGREAAGEIVPDLSTLLQTMANNRNTLGPAQLAADMTPRIEVDHQDTFSLVVGETFADRVLFWNERSLFPVYLGRDFTNLIVAPGLFEAGDFVARLAEMIRSRNGVYGANGQAHVTLKSTSIPAEQLQALRERFQVALGWMNCRANVVADLDQIVPRERDLLHGTALITGRLFDESVDWKEFGASGVMARISPILPPHLHGIPVRSIVTNGAWAVDLDIERKQSLTSIENVRHRWGLPRRLRMHGAFRGPYEISGRHASYRRSRSTREGYLALYTEYGEDPRRFRCRLMKLLFAMP